MHRPTFCLLRGLVFILTIQFSLNVATAEDVPRIAFGLHWLRGVEQAQWALVDSFSMCYSRNSITTDCDCAPGWFIHGSPALYSKMQLTSLDIVGRIAQSPAESHMLGYVAEFGQEPGETSLDDDTIPLSVVMLTLQKESGAITVLRSSPGIRTYKGLPIAAGFSAAQPIAVGSYASVVFVFTSWRDGASPQFLGAGCKQLVIEDH